MNSVSARLDRLPITSIHRKAIIALAFAYFFELGDVSTFAFAAPSLMQQWNISVHTVAIITSAGFGGMFLGGILGGRIADLAGRKRGLAIFILTYTVASLLNAFAWDAASLAALRVMTGIGTGAMTVIANTCISELFPARLRGKYLASILTIGLIGIPATALVARAVIPLAPWGWRCIFVWGSLGVVSLYYLAKLPESPRWYQMLARHAEAESAIEGIEGVALKETGTLEAPAYTAALNNDQESTKYTDLFSKGQRGRTALLIVVWVFQTTGAYGFLAWVPTLLVGHGFSIVKSLTFTCVIAACNPLGSLVASRLVERFDRKWFMTAASAAIAGFGMLYATTFEPVFILVFGALVVIGIQSFVAAIYAYTPELFPTSLRSSGHGLVYGIGRLANVFSPLLIGTI
ncbi:MFS transporter, partial [uncultured Caballeronia sp.]|uniref:MFS transporter n=1 Tax=uncultured Caballeronia sp. TaxID=1827198 RepID=UPI0035C951C3